MAFAMPGCSLVPRLSPLPVPCSERDPGNDVELVAKLC